MQIQVTEVSDIKTTERGTSSKIHAGNDYYYINEDGRQYIGKTLEIESQEKTSGAGRKYKVATIVKVLSGQTESAKGNGKLEWSEYDKLARVAHKLALELEPDSIGAPLSDNDPTAVIDRSRARITFVNTALMALKDGKLCLDDDIPF